MNGPGRPRRPSSRPKGFDDVPELSPEEVERRIDVRGGGSPPVPVPVERAVRDLRRPRRSQRTVARDSLLLLGLVVVGLATVRLVLPDGPLTGSATNAPSGSAVAVESVAPPTLGPILTPSLVTLTPNGSPGGPSAEPSLAPTPLPEPTPTLAPGQTPRPTPRPTRTPTPTKTPTPTAGQTQPNRATVIVVMHVVNNSGGTASASDWDMVVTGDAGSGATPNGFPGSEAGTAVSIPAGTGYRIADDASQAGYAGRTSSADCSRPDGGAGLAAGTTVTCTITRNDRPRVRVVTDVVGGTASAADVDVTVDGANATPSFFEGSEAGVVVVVGFDLTYGVSQSDLPGYTTSSAGACAGSLGVDEPIAECTFTFTFDEPPATGAAAPIVPLAVLAPVLGAAAFGGRRRWTTARSR